MNRFMKKKILKFTSGMMLSTNIVFNTGVVNTFAIGFEGFRKSNIYRDVENTITEKDISEIAKKFKWEDLVVNACEGVLRKKSLQTLIKLYKFASRSNHEKANEFKKCVENAIVNSAIFKNQKWWNTSLKEFKSMCSVLYILSDFDLVTPELADLCIENGAENLKSSDGFSLKALWLIKERNLCTTAENFDLAHVGTKELGEIMSILWRMKDFLLKVLKTPGDLTTEKKNIINEQIKSIAKSLATLEEGYLERFGGILQVWTIPSAISDNNLHFGQK